MSGMGRILLLQIDGKIPNLALMRITAHHRARGDEVELRYAPSIGAAQRRLGDAFDDVYASLIFERSRPIAQEIRRIYPRACIGGTGWDLATTLGNLGITAPPDYSLYPRFRQSLGFTQRGCRLGCPFCVVPRKEGTVREEATIADIWRGEPWPRELLLLDNDFFGQPRWRDRIAEIREGGFKVSFNQGINARIISDEAAEAIASVNYRDDGMKNRRIYTAWDNRKDEAVLFRGLRRLVKYGIKPDHIMVYMLIGYWAGETEEDWLYRAARLRDFGCRPYPMPFVRNNLTRGFQRWLVGAYDKRISWPEWKAANCEPRNLKTRGGLALPLFDVLNEASGQTKSIGAVGQLRRVGATVDGGCQARVAVTR